MNDQSSDEKYEWESGGEFGDGQGPGFGEGDCSDDYDSSENEQYNIESTILEAFETLGLDPKTELIKNQLKRAIVY